MIRLDLLQGQARVDCRACSATQLLLNAPVSQQHCLPPVYWEALSSDPLFARHQDPSMLDPFPHTSVHPPAFMRSIILLRLTRKPALATASSRKLASTLLISSIRGARTCT